MLSALPYLLGEVTGPLAVLCQAKLSTPKQMCQPPKGSGNFIHQKDSVLLKSRVFSDLICELCVESAWDRLAGELRQVPRDLGASVPTCRRGPARPSWCSPRMK